MSPSPIHHLPAFSKCLIVCASNKWPSLSRLKKRKKLRVTIKASGKNRSSLQFLSGKRMNPLQLLKAACDFTSNEGEIGMLSDSLTIPIANANAWIISPATKMALTILLTF